MGSTRRFVAGGLVVLALGAGIAACGSDDDSGSAKPAGTSSGDATPAATTGTAISIEDFAYEPRALRATAGDTITVTNTDDTAHTVTADDGGFDTGDIAGAGTATFTVGGPGQYRYHCDIHNYMTGTVTVSE
jgi:plastocyanin